MGIQGAQHTDDRRLIHIVVVELVAVNVMLLNDFQRFAEILFYGFGGIGCAADARTTGRRPGCRSILAGRTDPSRAV